MFVKMSHENPYLKHEQVSEELMQMVFFLYSMIAEKNLQMVEYRRFFYIGEIRH